jgi:multimeric flavodoxin WrbA
MRIVAINGSPRRKGNTHLLLEAVLAPLAEAGWETELLQIGGKPLHGCLACGKCRERRDGRCAFEKDDFNAVFERMLAADAILPPTSRTGPPR